jgi:hypothetical protein
VAPARRPAPPPETCPVSRTHPADPLSRLEPAARKRSPGARRPSCRLPLPGALPTSLAITAIPVRGIRARIRLSGCRTRWDRSAASAPAGQCPPAPPPRNLLPCGKTSKRSACRNCRIAGFLDPLPAFGAWPSASARSVHLTTPPPHRHQPARIVECVECVETAAGPSRRAAGPSKPGRLLPQNTGRPPAPFTSPAKFIWPIFTAYPWIVRPTIRGPARPVCYFFG